MAAKAKPSTDLHVSLTPAAEASQGVSLVSQAQGLVIRTREDHEAAREFQKGAKELKKKIIAHYKAIKDPLNGAITNVREMEKRDIAPIDRAIEIAEQIDTAFVREQKRIEAEEAERLRVEAERKETERRQKEADKAEAAALKLEAASDDLSEREKDVVSLLVAFVLRNGNGIMPTMSQWADAVERNGYKNVAASVNRLMQSKKITDAIAAQLKAVVIRREAEARQAAPITVEVVTKPSEVVDGGIRTYYGCGEVDIYKLAEAVLRGTVSVESIQPNMTYLNTQARALKELFPQSHPGCRLTKRDGTTTR